jgi:hypothetical protein
MDYGVPLKLEEEVTCYTQDPEWQQRLSMCGNSHRLNQVFADSYKCKVMLMKSIFWYKMPCSQFLIIQPQIAQIYIGFIPTCHLLGIKYQLAVLCTEEN